MIHAEPLVKSAAAALALLLFCGGTGAESGHPAGTDSGNPREPQDPRQAAVAALATIQRLVAMGRPAEAYRLLPRVVRAASAAGIDTAEIRFLTVQGLLADRLYAEAADILGKLADERPEVNRIQLDYALALFVLGRDDEAGQVFREVRRQEGLPEPVRRNIEDFLERIRARQRLKVDFDFGFWRDDNVNNASESDTVAIPAFDGLRFTLDQRPVRAWVTRTGLRIRWREPVVAGKGAYFETHASAARNTARGASEHNRTWASVSTGPRVPYAVQVGKRRRPGLARADLGVERRWRGGEGYETALWLGLGLDQTLAQDWRAGCFSQVWATRHDGGAGLGEPPGRSLGLYAARRLGPGWLTASTRASRQRSKIPTAAWRSHEAAVRFTVNLGRNVSFSTQAKLTRTRFDGENRLFRTSRKDRTRGLDLTVSHRKLVWKGYLPELTVSLSRTGSSIALYDRDLRTVRLGLRRLF